MTPRPAARKRLTPPASVTPPRKRTRGAGRRSRRTPTDTDSDAETPDIERRSLHNDMERMRRIGLKNLFDELKNQIPATRDKERAPKVVILREAAMLCRRLQDEDLEREFLKRQQNKLMTKLRKLRSQLATRYRSYWARKLVTLTHYSMRNRSPGAVRELRAFIKTGMLKPNVLCV